MTVPPMGGEGLQGGGLQGRGRGDTNGPQNEQHYLYQTVRESLLAECAFLTVKGSNKLKEMLCRKEPCLERLETIKPPTP